MQSIKSLLGGNRQKPNRRAKAGRKSNRSGLQRPQNGYVYQVSNGPTRSPPMPKEFSVSLWDHEVVTQNPAAGQTKLVFGLLEYLNRIPLYLIQFYTMYKYSRVLSVNYHFDIVNHSAAPNSLEIIFGIVPFSDVSGSTAVTLSEKPGAVRRLVSPTGGMDRASINKFGVAQSWVGNPYNTKDYWVTSTQAASTVPLDAEEPVGLLIITPMVGNIAFTLSTKITYNIQFFDLEAMPFIGVPKSREIVEDESFEEEPVLKKAKQPSTITQVSRHR